MNSNIRSLVIGLAALLLPVALCSCSNINEGITATMGDYVPQWAGGLPADAPPRPGSTKYDAWMKEREANRLLPASERKGAKPDRSELDPVR
ncbi:hypothetical protein FXB41_13810 [Bradyrhizobium canariense]|uniref:hypothetical protein n=1 Tax=Bradyrhizobium canariense TaxID=255045 RepID=UPI001CA4BE02|nr:hypothetical protein [Bradyrhizobium canariense]MBW5435819.1 hypothetical protein [Bradyrhizobium canariense]